MIERAARAMRPAPVRKILAGGAPLVVKGDKKPAGWVEGVEAVVVRY
jgi:hypothetical protein